MKRPFKSALAVLVVITAALAIWYARRVASDQSVGEPALYDLVVRPDHPPSKAPGPVREPTVAKSSPDPVPASESGPPPPLDPKAFELSQFSDADLDRDPDLGTPQSIRRRNGYLSPPAPGAELQTILAAFI